jgi:hypothetical protein
VSYAKPDAEERARERLNQPKPGAKRPPARTGSRPTGRIDPRKKRPPAHSTGRTAGIFGGAFVVCAVVVIFLVSLLSGPSGTAGSAVPFRPAPAAYVTAVTTVSPSQLAAAGLGVGQASPTGVFVATPKQALIKDPGTGLPVLVYVGAEYCPYCAASRWPLTIALSRFGKFTGLEIGASSPVDAYASTRTLSFAKATYTSPYLVFDSNELVSNVCAVKIVSNTCPEDNYTAIKTPSVRDQKLFTTYDTAPYFQTTGGIPFLDWGGVWVSSGSLYLPNTINLGDSTTALGWHPMSWQEIINNIQATPLTPAAEAILGSANLYTGAICTMTHGKPGSVCDTPVVKQAEKALPKS